MFCCSTELIYILQVAENRPAGYRVGTVLATDADGPPFNGVVYRLSSDGDATSRSSWSPAEAMFRVDRYSGEIVTATQIDREQVV